MLHRGEVLALLGENGAGQKHVDQKCLAVAHQPDAGTILVEGVEVQFPNPAAAIARRSGRDLSGI